MGDFLAVGGAAVRLTAPAAPPRAALSA